MYQAIYINYIYIYGFKFFLQISNGYSGHPALHGLLNITMVATQPSRVATPSYVEHKHTNTQC